MLKLTILFIVGLWGLLWVLIIGLLCIVIIRCKAREFIKRAKQA